MSQWPKTSMFVTLYCFLIYQFITFFSFLCSMNQSGTVKDDLKKTRRESLQTYNKFWGPLEEGLSDQIY